MKLARLVIPALLLFTQTSVGATWQDRSHGQWAKDLESKSEETREQAIRQLIGGQGEAVPVLLAIERMKRRARGLASRILQQEMGPAAADALVGHPLLQMRAAPTLENGKALLDAFGGSGVDWRVGQALQPLGADALEILLPVLDRDPTAFRDELAIMQALAAIGDLGPVAAPALPRVLRFFDDEEEGHGYYREAYRAVCGMGAAAEEAVPVMIRILLESGDLTDRTLACHTLGEIGPVAHSAIPALILAVQEDGLPKTRYGGKGFEPSSVRREAAEALAGFGEEARAAIPALTEALTDRTSDTRIQAAVALLRVGGDPAVATSAIVNEFRRPDRTWMSYQDAALQLAELGPHAASAVPALADLLLERNQPAAPSALRRNVAFALMQMGAASRAAGPALEAVLDDPHGVGFAAALALFVTGEEPRKKKALSAIESHIGNHASSYRRFAVKALELSGKKARHALPLLMATLGSHTTERALAIFRTLGSDAAPTVPDLLRVLTSPWRTERCTAAKALSAIGPAAAAAVPALTEALKDPRPDVRAAVRSALDAIGGE